MYSALVCILIESPVSAIMYAWTWCYICTKRKIAVRLKSLWEMLVSFLPPKGRLPCLA